MKKLPEEVYAGIQQLCAAGDEAVNRGEFGDAIGLFKRALELLPQPVIEWEAATWIYGALGDTYFQRKQMLLALAALDEAMRSPNGVGNPFVHLRRGQVLFEVGRSREAADELTRAFMFAGEEIFSDEDPKYLEYLKSILRPTVEGN